MGISSEEKMGLKIYQFMIQTLHPNYDSINQKKYTYIIDAIPVPNAWENMKSKYRNRIKNTLEKYTLDFHVLYREFRSFILTSFKERNKKNPYPLSILDKIENTLTKSNERSIFGIRGNKKELLGSIYLIMDEKVVYNFINGSRGVGNTMSALIWASIQFTLETGRSFDFEGSMVPGVEKFIKNFAPYRLFIHTSTNIAIRLSIKSSNSKIQK